MLYASIVHTPLGYMRAVATQTGLARLEWQQTPLSCPPSNKVKAKKIGAKILMAKPVVSKMMFHVKQSISLMPIWRESCPNLPYPGSF